MRPKRVPHTVLGTGDVTRARELAYTAVATAMVMTIASHVDLVAGDINGARALFEECRTLFDRIGNPI
jgi:hypothetical protein